MARPHASRIVEKLSLAGTLVALAGLAAAFGTGCSHQQASLFESRLQTDLRRSLAESTARELREAERRPDGVTTLRSSGEAGLGIQPEHLEEVRRMSGLESYVGSPLPFQEDLLGGPGRTVSVSLERLVKSAVNRNVAVQFARLGPAISSAQVTAAEAAFDWTFFSNLSFQNLNEPTSTQSQTTNGSFGLRRTTVSGGRLTIQNESSYSETKPQGNNTTNVVAYPAAVTIQYDQPLLRGFGSEVTLAEVRIARNAERNAVQTLRRDLMRVVTDVETTYWQLVSAHQDVLILQRLHDRGVRVRDQLVERARAGLDANEAQIASANSRVSNRALDIARAQTQLALLSDRLKSLVNSPEFPVGSTVVLIPSDFAIDQPIRYSLAESIRSALRYRPEIHSSIIAIDDASIRQVVARNAKLPDLSIRLQSRIAGNDDTLGEAYGELGRAEFVNYVVGLAFEAPIGNRRAESEYRRRILERLQSVLAYENTVQTVVNEVLSALRQINLYYDLIDQTRTVVTASAQALRVLTIEKEIGPGFTIERLNLEFQEQERLAQAEREQVQALTQYNTALAELFNAMGTSLERNNVYLVVPTTEDALRDARGTNGVFGEPVLKVKNP